MKIDNGLVVYRNCAKFHTKAEWMMQVLKYLQQEVLIYTTCL